MLAFLSASTLPDSAKRVFEAGSFQPLSYTQSEAIGIDNDLHSSHFETEDLIIISGEMRAKYKQKLIFVVKVALSSNIIMEANKVGGHSTRACQTLERTIRPNGTFAIVSRQHSFSGIRTIVEVNVSHSFLLEDLSLLRIFLRTM